MCQDAVFVQYLSDTSFLSLRGAPMNWGNEAIPEKEILNPKHQILNNIKSPNTNAKNV